jgi:hypothetical protein
MIVGIVEIPQTTYQRKRSVSAIHIQISFQSQRIYDRRLEMRRKIGFAQKQVLSHSMTRVAAPVPRDVRVKRCGRNARTQSRERG